MKNLFLLVTLLSSFAANSAPYKAWACQLQDYQANEILKMRQSRNMLWVIDYSKDGTEPQKWTPAEVASIKKNNNTVLAYVSLGEAEFFRSYWKEMSKSLLVDPTSGNGGVEGNWEGNYAVKYWLPEWQSIFIKNTRKFGVALVKQIVDQGFDGLFLDRADVFEFYQQEGEEKMKEKAQQMAEFVRAISEYGKSLNPHFKIYLQNATSFTWALKQPNYVYEAIDGQALEELYFRGNSRANNPFNPDKWVYKEVKEIKRKYGLPVIDVEYILKRKKDYKKYRRKARKDGIYPFIANLPLDGNQMVIFGK